MLITWLVRSPTKPLNVPFDNFIPPICSLGKWNLKLIVKKLSKIQFLKKLLIN